MVALATPYLLTTGSLIPCVLITGVNSDLPGPVEAQVREPVYDSMRGQHLLIPQGAKVIGHYGHFIDFGQNRVQLVFNRIIFPPTQQYPNGYAVQLDKFNGLDLGGYAGIEDKVNNHYGRLFTGAALSSLLSATLQNQAGHNQLVTSRKQSFYNNIATQANEVGQAFVQQQMQRKPTLVVRQGMPFNVMVSKDLNLSKISG